MMQQLQLVNIHDLFRLLGLSFGDPGVDLCLELHVGDTLFQFEPVISGTPSR